MRMTYYMDYSSAGSMPSERMRARVGSSRSTARNACTAGGRGALAAAESRTPRAQWAKTTGRTSAPPARCRRPSRRDLGRRRRRPHCASGADWRNRPASHPRAGCRPARGTRTGIAADHEHGRIGQCHLSAPAADRLSNRASPARKTKPCIRRQPGTSASGRQQMPVVDASRGSTRWTGATSHSPRLAAATPPRLPTAMVRAR